MNDCPHNHRAAIPPSCIVPSITCQKTSTPLGSLLILFFLFSFLVLVNPSFILIVYFRFRLSIHVAVVASR